MDEEKQYAPQDTTTRQTVPTTGQTVAQPVVLADAAIQRPASDKADYTMNVAARFIWFVGGVVIALIGLRFVLRLLGANPNNGFADFIYSVSNVFVSPFIGLFNADTTLTQGRVEFESLIAILVYALVAWGLARLVMLGKR